MELDTTDEAPRVSFRSKRLSLGSGPVRVGSYLERLHVSIDSNSPLNSSRNIHLVAKVMSGLTGYILIDASVATAKLLGETYIPSVTAAEKLADDALVEFSKDIGRQKRISHVLHEICQGGVKLKSYPTKTKLKFHHDKKMESVGKGLLGDILKATTEIYLQRSDEYRAHVTVRHADDAPEFVYKMLVAIKNEIETEIQELLGLSEQPLDEAEE
jgi:hypothetical protein